MSTYMSKQHLYLIAIIPPEPIYSEVKEFQKYMAEKYKSVEAFTKPVHITLIPPFQLEDIKEPKPMKFINDFAAKQHSFELSVENFGSFGVGVIYAALEENPLLNKLHKDLSLSFNKQFRPPGERKP